MNRRIALKNIGAASAISAVSLPTLFSCESDQKETSSTSTTEDLFKISLAQWSLHRATLGEKTFEWSWGQIDSIRQTNARALFQGTSDPLDFPVVARQEFDIEAVELVNTMYFDRTDDTAYLNELKSRANNEDVKILLIMIDGEGHLGNPEDALRKEAIERHYRWVNTAKLLGCHSIRVNMPSSGEPEEMKEYAIDGLSRLSEYATKESINVIVENHGVLSSNGEWLADVMTKVNMDNCGTLPDFGNFKLGNGEWYDRYKGVTEMMPFAKAISAKSKDFNEAGEETNTDYLKMMKIVTEAGYNGYVGIEYEGDALSEYEGIKATKKLLESVREKLSNA